MADNDLLFNITAIDHYKAEMDSAYALAQRQVQADQAAIQMTRGVEEAETARAAAGRNVAQTEKDVATETANSTQKIGELSGATRDAGNNARDSVQGFESFKGTLVSVQAGISIAKEALSGLKEVWDFAKEGAQNQQIAESFQRTAKSIGGSADEIIAKLDAASKGTIDDEELMQASTRALTLGVAKNGDDLVKVMQLARSAALAFGGDTGQAFETINYAIGNLTPRALKQFGIIIDLKKANEDYAKANHLVVASLTEEEQRQALLNAVLEQGQKNFGDIANAATTTAEKMKAVETRLANIVDSAKELIATGLATAFQLSDEPAGIMETFRAVAAKLRVEVSAGRMTTEDYNKAITGIALNMRDAGYIMRQTDLDAEKLTETQTKQIQSWYQVTQGAYGYSGALDETNRTNRSATEEQQKLAEAQRGATTGAYGLNGALDESNRALQRTKDAAKNAADSLERAGNIMSDLKVAMGGQLQKEQDDFNKRQDDLATKAAKVREELDKLQASQGKAITTTSKHTLTTNEATLAQLQLAKAQRELDAESAKGTLSADELAAAQAKLALNQEKLHGATKLQIEGSKQLTAAQQALKSAQAELNNNTDPLKQAKLAVEVDNLKEKLGQAAGAVGKYVDNSKKISELQGQYNAINKEINENAAAHDEATKRILFDYAEQQLAVGGLTEKEAEALDALAVKWKLKSAEDVLAMKNIREAAQGLAADGSIDEFVGNVGGALDVANGALTETQQKLADVAVAHGALAGQAPVDLKVGADTKPAQASVEDLARQLHTMPPIEIKTTLAPVAPIGAQADGKTAAAARDAQVAQREAADRTASTAKAVTTATDLVTGYTKQAIDATGKLADSTASSINSVADKTKVRFGDVSTSVISAITNMAGHAATDLNQVKNLVDELPTYKELIYHIKVTGKSDIPGAQHGADYIVPPNPRGGSGDYFPVLAAPYEHVTITPAGQSSPTAAPGQRANITTNNNTYNLYDAMAAKQITEQQRLERLKSVAGAM